VSLFLFFVLNSLVENIFFPTALRVVESDDENCKEDEEVEGEREREADEDENGNLEGFIVSSAEDSDYATSEEEAQFTNSEAEEQGLHASQS